MQVLRAVKFGWLPPGHCGVSALETNVLHAGKSACAKAAAAMQGITLREFVLKNPAESVPAVSNLIALLFVLLLAAIALFAIRNQEFPFVYIQVSEWRT